MITNKNMLAPLVVLLLSSCSTYQPKTIIPQINHTNNQQLVDKENESDSDKIASVLDESIVSIQKLHGQSFEEVEEKNIYQFTISLVNGSEDAILFNPKDDISIRVKGSEKDKVAEVQPFVGRDAFEHMKKRLGPGAGSAAVSVLHLVAGAASVASGNGTRTAATVNHLDTVLEQEKLAEQLAYLSGKKELKMSTLNYGDTTTGVLVVDLNKVLGNEIEISIQVAQDIHTFKFCRSQEGLYCYEGKSNSG